MKTAIIIGGGLEDCLLEPSLPRKAYGLSVLEKNATAGGGLQSFHRFGESFDTGMHVIGGMQPGGNIYRICEYLGILDQVKQRCRCSCYGLPLLCRRPGRPISSRRKRRFHQLIICLFPGRTENLQRYVDAIFAISRLHRPVSSPSYDRFPSGSYR